MTFHFKQPLARVFRTHPFFHWYVKLIPLRILSWKPRGCSAMNLRHPSETQALMESVNRANLKEDGG